MTAMNIAGQRFGKLTALRRVDNPRHDAPLWECVCDCGNHTIVRLGNLRSGHTQSCGCCNHYIKEGNHIRCVVKGGQSFIFDPEDFPKVREHQWDVSPQGYVSTVGHMRLHRLLTKAPEEAVVDHINGDPSDNRRCNLRITTQSGNLRNSRLRSDSTTGYKGVSLDKRDGMYRAYINYKGKQISLGYYDTPEEAAAAYDKAAVFYFGEFARTNQMLQEEENEQILEVG